MPAAVMGDMCTCVGPPDSIIMGSVGVFIGGKPAARMGDQTAHGGAIVLGCPTVLIGEAGGGGSGSIIIRGTPGSGTRMYTGTHAAAMENSAEHGTPFCAECAAVKNK
jgi:hypothetical protein